MQKQQVSAKKASFVKVSNDRLNALIDIVGELVVNQSMLRQYLNNAEVPWRAAIARLLNWNPLLPTLKILGAVHGDGADRRDFQQMTGDYS